MGVCVLRLATGRDWGWGLQPSWLFLALAMAWALASRLVRGTLGGDVVVRPVPRVGPDAEQAAGPVAGHGKVPLRSVIQAQGHAAHAPHEIHAELLGPGVTVGREDDLLSELLDSVAARLLGAALEACGVGETARRDLVDAVLDWRDRDDLRRLHGVEDDEEHGEFTPARIH